MDWNWKRVTLAIAILVLLLFIFGSGVYIKSERTCGTIIEETEIRGARYIRYKFQVDGETIYGSVTSSHIVSLGIDSLKRIECIEIQYSNFSSVFNRLVDDRILKK